MPTKRCIICAAEFTAGRNEKTCSRECSRLRLRQMDGPAKDRFRRRHKLPAKMYSARDDGRGHWPKGKRRSEPAIPMRAVSYLAVARRLHKLAGTLEAKARPVTPRDRAALTQAVHQISGLGRELYNRHHGRPIHDPDL